MAEQRAECGFGRGRGRGQGTAGKFGGGEARGDKADRGAFDIAFTAGDLAREADMRRRFQAELPVEQFRRADEAVAVEAAQPRELGLLQAGDGAEHADLFGMLELGLEADHVPQRADRIVLTELDNGPGPAAGARLVKSGTIPPAKPPRFDPRSAER